MTPESDNIKHMPEDQEKEQLIPAPPQEATTQPPLETQKKVTSNGSKLPPRHRRFDGLFEKAALGATAIGIAVVGGRAGMEGSPTAPAKDLANIARNISGSDSSEKPQTDQPTQTSEGETAIVESSSSTLEPKQSDQIDQIYDKFEAELEKIPAAILLGTTQTDIRGVRVHVDENTYTFTHSLNNPQEKKLTVENDGYKITYDIKQKEVFRTVQDKGKTKESTPFQQNFIESLTNQLQEAYNKWDSQRQKTQPTPNSFQTPATNTQPSSQTSQ